MDLHLIPGAEPTAEERDAVDSVLGPPASSWEGGERRMDLDGHSATGGHKARGQRHLLLPTLWALQSRIGWIGPGGLNYICRRLTVPPAEAYGVATFYSMLSVEKRPRLVAHVCNDIACRVRGSGALASDLTQRYGPAGTPTPDGGATWHDSPCLGMCERAPAVLFQAAGDGAHDWVVAPAESPVVVDAMEGRRTERASPLGRSGSPSAPQTCDAAAARGLKLLSRVGRIDPGSLDEYRSHGGYEALRRALSLGPEGILREVTDSRLMGRGGAAFPTGRKWEAVARAPARPHYLVCNADESEPGTFKDRLLMEEDPFTLVEAMTIAGYATGCERGYIYVRGEYPTAIDRLETALAAARLRGLLGPTVMGERFAFDMEVRRGAGAYICGEETALFNSIEGFRGEPRNKPPFPVQVGLFGKPTAINNVETLANIPRIILEGGPAFASTGSGQSSGTKLFCLSGCITRPGVYEVPFGTTLRQILDLAGGVPGGRGLRAILLGGAAGSFVTPEELDVPLTFEGTRAIGASLGSGVVMPFDDQVDLHDIVLRIASFFRDESCGQCVPCRVGTERQEESLLRLRAGRALRGPEGEAALLKDIAAAMRDASICGLGQTAAGVVQSAVAKLGLFLPATGTGSRR